MTTIIKFLFMIGLPTLISATCDFSSYYCAISGVTCPTSSNILQVGNDTYSGSDLDVISFDSITLINGDVKGRVATRNDFYGLNTITVGQYINDNKEYALIVGDDLFIQSGEVYPLNRSIYVGGSRNVPANLQQRNYVNHSSCRCLNSSFENVLNYWIEFSNILGSQRSNANITLNSGNAIVTCSSSAIQYINISSSAFSQIIEYTIGASCLSSSAIIFNIYGGGDVTFCGLLIDYNGLIIYNVLNPSTIYISSPVKGYIVAPRSNIIADETIYGQVIAGNITRIVRVDTYVNGTSGGTSSGTSNGNNFNGCPLLPGSSTSGSPSTSGSRITSGTASTTSSTPSSTTGASGGLSGSFTTGTVPPPSTTATPSTTAAVTTSAVTTSFTGSGIINVENSGMAHIIPTFIIVVLLIIA